MDLTFLYRIFVVLLCFDVTISTPVKNEDNTQNGKSPAEKIQEAANRMGINKKYSQLEKGDLLLMVNELLQQNENQKRERSEVKELKEKMALQEEETHDLRLKFGTLTVGEAISKVRRKRHPEERYEVHSEEDEEDKNKCSVIRDRNQNVAHKVGIVYEYQGKSFTEQFFPVMEDYVKLLTACIHFISKGNDAHVYQILSKKSYSYLAGNSQTFIDWGCYCMEHFGKPTLEDEENVVEMFYKLYKPRKNITTKFLAEKCKY